MYELDEDEVSLRKVAPLGPAKGTLFGLTIVIIIYMVLAFATKLYLFFIT